jgi:hypothetical protein
MKAESLFRVLGIHAYTQRHEVEVTNFIKHYTPEKDVEELLGKIATDWSELEVVKTKKWFDTQVWPISPNNPWFSLIRKSNAAFRHQMSDNDCAGLVNLISEYLKSKAESVENLFDMDKDEDEQELAIPLKSIGLT